MVRALHEAGIEVILDVVYNHTAEGDHRGPTLSFRGIDNAAYYRLNDDDRTLLPGLHRVRQQFQRALAARPAAHHGLAALLDPGSARGRVPVRPRRRRWPGSCTTWTGCRRSSTWFIRTRWCLRSSSSPSPGTWVRAATRWATSRRCGASGTASTGTPCATSGAASTAALPEFASRLTGLAATCTRPAAAARWPRSTSSPATTASPWPTWCPTTRKHNEANGEDNRDGTDDNRSWNCGVEGPTDDPAVNELRARQRRNFLATLFCSQGVPMLLAGDELGPHPARQQQRLLPGQRGLLGGLGHRGQQGRPARLHPRSCPRCAASTRCSAAAGSSAAIPPVTGTWRTSPGSPRPAGR